MKTVDNSVLFSRATTAWAPTELFTLPLKKMPAAAPIQPERAAPRRLRAVKLATITLVRVLRNASFSILVGWLFGYVYTTGNVASGLSPAEQSYASYVAANGAWFHGVFSATIVVLFAIRLTPEKFVIQAPRNAPKPDGESASCSLTLTQCSFKLLWRMTPHLIATTAAEVVGCYLLIQYLPPSGRKYKPAMYMNSFWSNFVLASADYCTRDIYSNETIRGLARRQLREKKKDRSSARRHSWMSSTPRYLTLYVRILPGVLSSLIAIVYVHSISLFVTISRESELLAFAIGSIALKLTLQEVAKRHLLSTATPLPRRLMIVLVSTPTILVDTQVRMLLLRLQDVNISVLGSALLALTEISVRTCKSILIHREVQHVLKKRIEPTFGNGKETAVEPTPKRRVTITADTEARGQRHLVVHAAEIYADMYAEYLAMGCSYAIMFFFGDHPQYQFVAAAEEKSAYTQQMNKFTIFAFQVGVEMVVDLFACSVEALQGVDFTSFDQNDPFLTFFMSLLAFANVSISAGLYIRS
ncbi:hypothetical protein V7S43_016598 [Phytophthora oleae]|uniref:Uncharacterized protein n=1 Tax=Phytophthora oleae TaxID=2107226 RepID=A0ABD3EYQ2_9STRA